MTHVPKNLPHGDGSRSCPKAKKPNLIQATLGPVGPQMWSHALATNSRQYWHVTCVLGDFDPCIWPVYGSQYHGGLGSLISDPWWLSVTGSDYWEPG